jgi:polyhydroxyalkanoate synthase subunit PhaC
MTEKPDAPFPGLDPLAIGRRWGEIALKSPKALTSSTRTLGQAGTTIPASALYAWGQFWQGIALDPGRLVAPVAAGEPNRAAPRDRRFKHAAWETEPAFRVLLENYRRGADWLRDLVEGAEHLSPADKRRVSFYAEQFIDAVAPTNYWATNPEVLEKMTETGGRNLLEGFSNFLDDVAAGAGHVRRADSTAFDFGVTIAATPGSVIYRNDLMELIQFEPTTPAVDRTPLLIVPPWVNKYYLFDLRKKSSFIGWAVDQGLTVFVISWVNPDERHAGKDFENYFSEGFRAAVDRVLEATGESKVNIFSYCLGGTLTAAGLACLAAENDDRVASATLVATMTDFSDVGDFEVFVDPQQIDDMRRSSAGRGYLTSGELAHIFSLLRANDLIWSSAVSRYLLAEDPLASDMLYWFSDGIGMPATMLETFLRRVILNNALSRPGGISFAGTPVDLARVKTPLCFISMKEDHVATWQSTYRGARQFQTEKRFILGGSGHNAGTINPPAAGRHGYWLSESFPDEPEAWLADARRHEGSWWTEWRTWLERFGGEKVPSRPVAEGHVPVLEAAPGSYARDRH